MAKHPSPGHVKTRLVSSGVAAVTAAAIAEAMLICVVRRCRQIGRVVLAVSPDGDEPAWRKSLPLEGVDVIGQGEGDLGERLGRVWCAVGEARPIAFFGMDSPDVPLACLRSIRVALSEADVAIGPTGDGGYWTLAARAFCPQVLQCIDWGTESVYDQTCCRVRDAGLRRIDLPDWHDVDDRADLDALRSRLSRLEAGGNASDDDTEPLLELARRLDELLEQPPTSGAVS